ncbi:radical SAM protein [Panacibacter ginsenosidivorans]|uniref:Radical SAM protein n=1 Tax=Panacibacter ginsenosidivorans TaxID=1813871 RepID=A0A5B8V8W2_9BACT|nr:radical SAM protein [Panacibacter ginsenosidivorans]QEC67669.1 radical SAM protein [Panacibacter ginsenosidivorans]
MQTFSLTAVHHEYKKAPIVIKKDVDASNNAKVKGMERSIIWLAIKLRIFFIACITLKKPVLIWRTYKAMLELRRKTWGIAINKIYRVHGRYYFNLYTPGWPSAAYDSLIKNELLRHAKPLSATDKLTFIFLAVTRKCPMRCEHCFEWDNLNKKETFTQHELKEIVDIYQQQGVLQIHFSGGEPLVRVHDLIEVIKHAKNKSECYVVTSGFNLTATNAALLKEAGCKGIIVSIDHYIPELHNGFRNHADIFFKAVEGVQASLKAGMVTALSVCVTKAFINGGHLIPYFEFAKTLGVHFVQLLEPKNVGHYADKDVLLEEEHVQQLETFFKIVNHDATYKDYPTVMYHGYHQRRIGCYSGSRSVYIDSAGDVHACPFCHTASYNIATVLKSAKKEIPVKENLCPRYGNIV